MERKYLIAVALLSAGLLGGTIVLICQNGGIGNAHARLASALGGRGSNWVQIQPRVKSDANDSGSDSKTAANNMIALSSAQTGNAVKAKPAPVKWCAPAAVEAIPIHDVIFSEIAWMGTAVNYSDEWIELKNITAVPVDISGWQLQNKNQKLKVSFDNGQVLGAGDFYLLERTDDGAVPGVSANKIYTGSLANSNETIYLLIPVVICGIWPPPRPNGRPGITIPNKP